MTDRFIRRFKLNGEFNDDRYEQTKETAIRELVASMKDEGWVPVLDLDYTWRTRLVGSKFEYHLTMQGVFVGLETAWDYQGVTNGRLVPSSPKTS